MSYIGKQPVPQSLQSRQQFTGDGSTTTFTTIGGVELYEDVFLNGVRLSRVDNEYSFDGTTLTITPAPANGDTVSIILRNDHSELIALPITDSQGNNVLSESGGVVSVGGVTFGGDVAMASSGLTVRNISQTVLTSDQTLSNSTTLTTFFSPTYTPLFAGSKVLGILTLVYIVDYNGSADGRKDFQIEFTGSGITDTVQMGGLTDNLGLYDYGNSGVQLSSFSDISSKLLTTSTTDVITANCKIANAQANANSMWYIRGASSNLETFFTWIEFK